MCACELIKKAYDRYIEWTNTTDGKVLGDEYTYQVKSVIDDFIHNRNMLLFADDNNEYLFARGNRWARIGPGAMARENFKLFLKDEQTRSLIRTILTNDVSQNKNLIRDYFDYRDQFSYMDGVYFPRAYTNRLFTILLSDISTTISKEDVLEKVANALGLFTNGKSFGEVQLDVRAKTDSCLKELGLFDRCSTFDKAVIPWFIHVELNK